MEYLYLKHPHTVRGLAEEMIKVCNDHKNRVINDDVMKEIITFWATYESEKMFKENDFNSSIVQIIGIRRIRLLNKFLIDFQK